MIDIYHQGKIISIQIINDPNCLMPRDHTVDLRGPTLMLVFGKVTWRVDIAGLRATSTGLRIDVCDQRSLSHEIKAATIAEPLGVSSIAAALMACVLPMD